MKNQDQPEPIPGIDRPLTPAECKRLAESFGDLPPEFQISAEDLEILEEELHSKALRYGTPQAAMGAMQRRLVRLKNEKARLLNTLDNCTENLRPILLESLEILNRRLVDAQARLVSYRFQQRHEN